MDVVYAELAAAVPTSRTTWTASLAREWRIEDRVEMIVLGPRDPGSTRSLHGAIDNAEAQGVVRYRMPFIGADAAIAKSRLLTRAMRSAPPTYLPRSS